MNDLSNTIYSYFVDHFDELPLDKQLHFASRLWVWRRDPTCRKLLDQIRPSVLVDGDLAQALQAIEAGTLIPLHQGASNLHALREPYFKKYPQLRMTSRLLYWATVLGGAYDLDARTALEHMIPSEDLAVLDKELRKDRLALATLSTHAVNFTYLYHRVFLNDEASPMADFWGEIATDTALYESTGKSQLQLQLYLLTHAVIGESCFYQRPIPMQKIAAYRQLVTLTEQLIRSNLLDVNLDNKLEFLVCCRLVGHQSLIEPLILDEAEQSISANGHFLVDIHNANKQHAFSSFDKSEHRNVLYLMATSESTL